MNQYPLPAGWRWGKLGEVLEYLQYGISQKSSWENKGYPILRMGNIEEGKLDLSDLRYAELPNLESNKYILRKRDILINRTNSAELVGKSAVFDLEGDYVFASYLIRLRVKELEADPYFINFAINSFVGRDYVSRVARRAIGQVNINAKEIGQMSVPLCSISEQRRIAARIQELMQEVDCARTACEKQLEAAKAIPAAYVRSVFESEEAKKWVWKKLGDVSNINPSRPRSFARSPDALTTFIPMAAVDERTGAAIKPEVVPYSKVSRGYTYFEENDVLFAKITPCMQNGKHMIARNLVDGIGFGTTEFHVLRPGKDIFPEWVWYLIRRECFLQEATRYFTGVVGQQRVPENFLANHNIPCPPLSVQKYLVVKFNEKAEQSNSISMAAIKQLDIINVIPETILKRAFKGEL